MTEADGRRFWAKVQPDPGLGACWRWTAVKARGYGYFSIAGKKECAHRLSYEQHVGPIPAGLQLDHLCRNRSCVNPDHLEAVTNRENLLRGNTIIARQAAQTHCKHGHEFTPQNTEMRPNGSRCCRRCRYDRRNRRRAQIRAIRRAERAAESERSR